MNIKQSTFLACLAASLAAGSGSALADSLSAAEAAAAPARLAGSHWMMALPKEGGCEVPPEISFKKDGTIEGNAGCNDFKGSWKAAGSALRIERRNTTSRNCGEKFLALEKAFGAALDHAASLKADGGSLILLDSRGQELGRIIPAFAGSCD